MKQAQGGGVRTPAGGKRAPVAMGAKNSRRARQTGSVEEPSTHMRIHEVAYALYEARGCVDGHDLEDWLAAEAAVARDIQGTRPGDAADH